MPRRRLVFLAACAVAAAAAAGALLLRASPAERAAELRSVAVRMLAVGRPSEAEPLLRRALADVPGDPETLALLGEVLLRGGRDEDGARALAEAVASRPEHARANTLLAARHLRRGELEDAAACVERAATAGPSSDELLLVRADVGLARGRIGAALDDLAAFADRRPGDAAACLRAAYVAEYLARVTVSPALAERARTWFEAATRDDSHPVPGRGTEIRAAALLGLGRPRDARSAIESVPPAAGSAPLRTAILAACGAGAVPGRAAGTAPGDAAASAAAVRSEIEAGRPTEAARALAPLRAAFPDAPETRLAARHLADAIAEAQMPDDLLLAAMRLPRATFNPVEAALAEHALRSAADVETKCARLAESGTAILAAARSPAGLGDSMRRFEAEVEDAVALRPACAAPYVWKAALRLRRGETAAAARALEAAATADRSSPLVFHVRALLNGVRRDWTAALADVERAAALGPESAALAATRVRLLVCAGRTRDAVDAGRAALRDSPAAPSLVCAQILALDADAAQRPGTQDERERGNLIARLALLCGDPGLVVRAASRLAGGAPSAPHAQDGAGVGAAWERAAISSNAPSATAAGDSAATTAQAALLVRLGRVSDAALALRAAAARSDDPKVAVLLQRLLAFRGDFAGAETVLRELLAAHPELTEADLALAGVLAAGGRVREAAARLRGIVGSGAPLPIRVTAARALLAASPLSSDVDAVERLCAAGAASSGDPRATVLPGWCRLARGDVEGALAVATAAAESFATSAEPPLLAGFAHAQARRLDDAERSLVAALAASPANAEALGLVARVRFERGSRAIDAGDAAAARRAFEDAVWGAESDFAALLLMAHACTGTDGDVAAEAIAVRLAARLPGAPAEPLFRGYAARARGRTNEAYLQFLTAAARSPDHPAALAALVDTAAALGDVAAAETACRAFVDRGDATGVGSSLLGMCLAVLRDAAGAEDAWRSSLDASTGNVAALARLVPVLAGSGRTERALALCRRARSEPAPFDERGVQALRALIASGNAACGGDRLRQRAAAVFAATPSAAWSRFETGRALAAAGDLDAAHAELDAAADLMPGETVVQLELLRVLGLRGRLDEAASRFDRMTTAHPREPAAWCMRAMLAEFRGDVASAERHYRSALAAAPDHTISANNLAWLLGETSWRPAEGLAVARAAKVHAPGDPDLADTLGWLLHRTGDHAEALRELEIAVRARPDNSHFHCHRAEALLALGRRDEARAAFEAVLRLDAAYAKEQGVEAKLAALAGR